MNRLREKIGSLSPVENRTAEKYIDCKNRINEYVDEKMAAREDIDELIGYNPPEVMFDNHEKHVLFMGETFKFNEMRLLADTLPWVYSVYREKGFSYRYFQVSISCWIDAVKKFIPEEYNQSIIEVYEWIEKHHEDIIALAEEAENDAVEVDEDWRPLFNEFIDALLIKEIDDCRAIIKENISSRDDLKNFAEKVIKPALYTVGFMWEQGNITVAEEHRASSIVSRILSSYHMEYLHPAKTKGRAVVSSVANEYHEIGARIVADFLEFDGWDVSFLGASTPVDELVEFLEKEQPDLLGLSVSMPYNVTALGEVIEAVRENENIADVKILVGGRALNDHRYLLDNIDYDAFAQNGEEAAEIARDWSSD